MHRFFKKSIIKQKWKHTTYLVADVDLLIAMANVPNKNDYEKIFIKVFGSS